ncbi:MULTISPECIES: hypothetical protein [Sporomusa]|uniref:hypothetical protein n=1 Tax=Sporomusa TaxID=2375 RepID=UPI003157F29A
MLKKFAFLLPILLIFLFSNINFVNAAGIYKHVQADDTTIVFYQDVRGGKDEALTIEVHKIFKPTRKNYDVVRIMANGSVASKYDIVSAKFIIDGSAYELTPLSGARKDDLPENIEQVWYQFSTELADRLRDAKKLAVCVNFTNGNKTEKNEIAISGSDLQRIKAITSMSDANIGQEHVRPYGKPESFRMFFPGIKPEEIGTGLVYQANYRNGKFNYYRDYYQASFRKDWTKFSLEYINRFWDRKYSCPFILAEMREENNGTTIKLDVLSKTYWTSSPPDYDQIDPKDKLLSSELWELDVWATRLMSLYQDLHGTYDYGLDWGIINTEKDTWKRMRKEWSVGPYDVSRVNKEQYKELQDVNIGDKITAINGKATDMLYYPKSVIATKYSGTPVEFTIRLQDGSEKIIKISPRFIPSTIPKINYLELINKHSGQLTKGTVTNGGFNTVFITYDPLGKREF